VGGPISTNGLGYTGGRYGGMGDQVVAVAEDLAAQGFGDLLRVSGQLLVAGEGLAPAQRVDQPVGRLDRPRRGANVSECVTTASSSSGLSGC
jgi:FAD/FMN-containing dehydrogenase